MNTNTKNKKSLGIMLDCSRNAVMKPEEVKKFAKLIADMGYNMLQLYTEDTYEIEDEPYITDIQLDEYLINLDMDSTYQIHASLDPLYVPISSLRYEE